MTDIEHAHAQRAKERIETLTTTIAASATELGKNIKAFSESMQKAIEEFAASVSEDAISANAALLVRMEDVRQQMSSLVDFMLGDVPKEIKGSTGKILTPAEIAAKREQEDRERAFQSETKPSVVSLNTRRDEIEQSRIAGANH